ncbi:MAG: tetratricopeptide repeat protein [Cyclobacteriaceae bacterium]|nr:tetratricopeptide repeat protein [Cyclobacteriaceae bacterium]
MRHLQYFLPTGVLTDKMFRYAFAFFMTLPLFLSAQDQLSRGRADELYRKGLELTQHRNFGAARRVFENFLEVTEVNDIRRTEATYQLAFCALQLGHADGEKRMEEFMDQYPAHPRAALGYFELANFFYQEKNYSKASNYYSKVSFDALSRDQQNEARFKWGYSLFSQKKLTDAQKQFNYVKIQNSSYAVAASYYAGFISYSEGKYEEALPDLKRAESNSSYANVVPVLIAGCYYHLKRYDDLLAYYQSLQPRASAISSFSDIALFAADALYFKRNYQAAISAYDTYLKNNAGKAPAVSLFRAGHASYMLGQENQAFTWLKAAASVTDTVSYYASYYLGILYVRQGNKTLARNAFDYARKHPDDKQLIEESTFYLAKVTYETGQADDAIREFEQFIARYPQSRYQQEARELLAQAYVNGNNYNKAIEYIEALPARNAAVREAYQKATFLKGAELFNKEDYAGAVQYFEKSLADAPRTDYAAQAAFWCGEALSMLKKTEEARAKYQMVLRLEKSAQQDILLRAYYGLGYVLFNARQYDQALPMFRNYVTKATRGTPMYTDGVIRLADCLYATKSYNEALSNYNRARQLGSAEDDYLLFQQGVINGILRNYSESRNQFNLLLSLYPRSTYREEALYQRAQFDIEQGNYQAAADGLSQLIREGAGSRFLPFAYLRRAASWYNLKQYDKAATDYIAIIQQFPAHPVAQQALPLLQESLNLAGRGQEFDKYLTAYKQANPGDKNLELIEFERAKNLYFEGQYAQAISVLQNFLSAYPESARATEVRFYLAESYFRQQQFRQALPLYEELQSNPSFTQAARAVQRIAEIHFREGRYEQAIAAYHRLERSAATKRDLYTAWSGLMESFYLTAQYDSVTVYAQNIIQRANISAGAVNKASLFTGKAAMARGDFDAAKDEFISTLNTARDEYGAEAKYRLAEIFYQTKQYRQCYETLISLNTDFAAYEEWVGRSYLLLADNFLAMNDRFNAKATLQSLVDRFPLPHIRDEARRKLNDLIQMEKREKEKQAAADTTGNK